MYLIFKYSKLISKEENNVSNNFIIEFFKLIYQYDMSFRLFSWVVSAQ